MHYKQIMDAAAGAAPPRLAVAAAADSYVLAAATAARAQGLASPILFGVKADILRLADEAGLSLEGIDIVDIPGNAQAARAAVACVHDGCADMLMKGHLQTATLLRAVLDKDIGLRQAEVLSHVSVLDSPQLGRAFLLTDAAMVLYPDLDTKAALVRNAVAAAQGLGIARPRVAALAAVEVVNPKMQATVDAALLTMMNRRGQLAGCVVDGPLAMDLALSPEAVAHKGIESEVAGRADILLLPNIDAANPTLKAFTVAGGCLFGGVIMGASVPIVLTSRSDSAQSKLFSIACAAVIAGSREVSA